MGGTGALIHEVAAAGLPVDPTVDQGLLVQADYAVRQGMCAGVTVHADDEGAGLRNDSQRGHPPSFRTGKTGHITTGVKPGKSHFEANCDEPQPPEAGQASGQRRALHPARTNRGKRTLKGQIVFSSHAPGRTTGINTAS